MGKRKVLVLLITFALVFAMGCLLEGNANGPKTGKYILQGTEVENRAWVLLKGDVSENEVYRFIVDGEKLIFKSGDIAEGWFKEGAVFKLAGKE